MLETYVFQPEPLCTLLLFFYDSGSRIAESNAVGIFNYLMKGCIN